MGNGIHQAMANIMAKVGAIGKDQRNQQQNFNFRGIDQVYNTLHALFAEEGVITIPRQIGELIRRERPNKSGGLTTFTLMRVEYDFVHADGSKITVGPIVGEGMDSGDKGANKALAVAHKYALLQTLMIPTEGGMVDPDRESYQWNDAPSQQPAGDEWGDQDWGEPLPPPLGGMTGTQAEEAGWDSHPADDWGNEPPPPQQAQPIPSQPAQAGRGPTININGDVFHIEDDDTASDAADFIIQVAESMHSSSMESLIAFWNTNKALIDHIDTHFPNQYAKLKQAFTNIRNNLVGATA